MLSPGNRDNDLDPRTIFQVPFTSFRDLDSERVFLLCMRNSGTCFVSTPCDHQPQQSSLLVEQHRTSILGYFYRIFRDHIANMPALLRRRLVCHYCGHKSALTRDSKVRRFTCSHCDSENYLDEVRITARLCLFALLLITHAIEWRNRRSPVNTHVFSDFRNLVWIVIQSPSGLWARRAFHFLRHMLEESAVLCQRTGIIFA
jgi:hypothetical protein